MKATILIMIALSIHCAVRKRSAAVRHWVLAAGILCAALTPVLGLVLPQWQVPLGAPAIARSSSETVGASATTEVAFSVPATPASSGRPPGVSLTAVFRSTWIAGTVLSLLMLVVGLCRLAWLASKAQQVSDPRWQTLLGPVRLLQSQHPTLLVTWGFFAPRIVLPASAGEWSEERMRIVLWHELAHIRRGDWSVQMLAELLRAAYWFNPLVWLACRRLRQESEEACDDEVLSRGVHGPEYAAELLGLVRELRRPRATLLSGFPAPAMARPSSLGRRVTAMLKTDIPRSPVTPAARFVTVVALLLVAIPIAAAQTFGTFSGTLVDATGGSLPDVRVVLSNTQRQSKYEVRSGPTGAFEFVGLPSGIYELDAEQRGFAALHESVSLAAGQNLQRRLTLHVGSLQETIVVKDPAASQTPDGKTVTRQEFEFHPADLSGCVVSAVGGNIRAPKKLRDMPPVYPASFRGATLDAVVVLDTTIGLDGYLKNIEVREGADPELASAAVTAVREWRFSQTILNCTPVEVSLKISTRFTNRP